MLPHVALRHSSRAVPPRNKRGIPQNLFVSLRFESDHFKTNRLGITADLEDDVHYTLHSDRLSPRSQAHRVRTAYTPKTPA